MSAIITNAATADANWIAEHCDALFRYAFVRVRDEATAEDLVQETLLAGLRNADGFAGTSSAGTWLTGILKHKIMDHYRRCSFTVELAAADDLFDEIDHWRDETAPVAWNNRTPLDDLENKRLAAVLKQALTELSPPLSTIFTLREIEGLGRDEICELLGISDSNYWVMMHRARLRLRHEVERQWGAAEYSHETNFDPAFQIA